MNKRGLITEVLFVALAATVRANPGDVRFCGGSYDGWDSSIMTNWAGLGGTFVVFSSGTNQTFAWTETNPALATLTITVEEDPIGLISNGITMHVMVPAAFALRFDPTVSVTFGGNATGKVGTATFSNDGRTLAIPVTEDFAGGDTLTVSGLKLVDLALCRESIQRLELDYTGDGMRDRYDQYTLTVRVTWPGGSYDGWDRCEMAQSETLTPRRGSVMVVR